MIAAIGRCEKVLMLIAVSKKQASGLWQIRPKFWGHSCLIYMLSPWHSTSKALAIVEQMKEKCGACWKVCYRYGPYHIKSKRCRAVFHENKH